MQVNDENTHVSGTNTCQLIRLFLYHVSHSYSMCARNCSVITKRGKTEEQCNTVYTTEYQKALVQPLFAIIEVYFHLFTN